MSTPHPVPDQHGAKAAEKRTMAQKGFVWNQLFGVYQFVGAGR